MKRAFDLIFSVLALVFLSPIFLSISLFLKLTSRGPVFYYSKRVGIHRKKIYCIKFRTMKTSAEKDLATLLKDAQYKNEWKIYHKLKKDPRVTFLGAFLRKTSLDELPQFFNVLKGDLSIVGPRPLSSSEIEKFSGPMIDKMLSVRPGITGISQTQGRNHLSIQKRIELEQSYIEKHSFLGDLKIIFKTIPLIITCKGAY